MAVLDISVLLNNGHRRLIEEGYVLEATIEEDDDVYDKRFIDPYYLYNENGERIDTIYYIEYCNYVVDDNYIDGRMTWDTIRAKWQRYSDNKEVYVYTL